jgi:two-component system alkaline phosphatase synthesis response regulator PhoP
MKTICLVEDERSIAELVSLNLELEGFRVLCFKNGGEAIEHLSDLCRADLVILDVMLPAVSGLEICRQIRNQSAVPVLFLSAKGTTEDRIAGLKLGGNDYLSKPFDLEELLLRVKILTHTQGFTKETNDTLQIGSMSVFFSTYDVCDASGKTVTTLSKREIQLLQMFAENEGKVVSRDAILDKIWGTDQYPTSRTIDNYILTFRKLFERNPKEPEYFHSIRAVGYKFTLPETKS